MLHERFTHAIPDEMPDLGDEENREEIERLFQQLRLKIKTSQSRRIEAAKKYSVGVNPLSELEARFDMLTDMFIGILSPERLRFELRWQESILSAVEGGIADVLERERQEKLSKKLHLPNGKTHTVAPAKEKIDGNSDESE